MPKYRMDKGRDGLYMIDEQNEWVATLWEDKANEIVTACNHFPAMKELLVKMLKNLKPIPGKLSKIIITDSTLEEIESLLREVNDGEI